MHTIGQAARLSGVHVETIRYYEREGVVPAPERSASGRRLHDEQSIARLRFVKRCRDLGFPVHDVRALLALSVVPDRSCADVKQVGERHLGNVRAKIWDLEELEEALIELLHRCTEEGDGCPAISQLFAE